MGDLIFLGTMAIQEAKELERQMKPRGVEIVLNHNEQTCRSGCSVSLEVWTTKEGGELVQKYLGEKYQQSLSSDQIVDWEKMQSVFDPSQEFATCPACGTKFSATKVECPDCGLRFA